MPDKSSLLQQLGAAPRIFPQTFQSLFECTHQAILGEEKAKQDDASKTGLQALGFT